MAGKGNRGTRQPRRARRHHHPGRQRPEQTGQRPARRQRPRPDRRKRAHRRPSPLLQLRRRAPRHARQGRARRDHPGVPSRRRHRHMGQPHPRPHRSPALRRRRGRNLRPADPRMLPHAARQTHRMREAGLAVERVRAHRMAGPTARRTARIPAGQQTTVRPIAHQPHRHEPDRQRRAHLPAQRSAGRTLLGPT